MQKKSFPFCSTKIRNINNLKHNEYIIHITINLLYIDIFYYYFICKSVFLLFIKKMIILNFLAYVLNILYISIYIYIYIFKTDLVPVVQLDID